MRMRSVCDLGSEAAEARGDAAGKNTERHVKRQLKEAPQNVRGNSKALLFH
jgi:hypothetical protein